MTDTSRITIIVLAILAIIAAIGYFVFASSGLGALAVYIIVLFLILGLAG
jgi:hypothetical protein